MARVDGGELADETAAAVVGPSTATRTSAFRGRASLSSTSALAGGASVAGARAETRRVAGTREHSCNSACFSKLWERTSDQFLRSDNLEMRTTLPRDGFERYSTIRHAVVSTNPMSCSQPDLGIARGGKAGHSPSNKQHLLPSSSESRPDGRRHAPRPHARPPLLETGARAQLLQSVAPS